MRFLALLGCISWHESAMGLMMHWTCSRKVIQVGCNCRCAEVFVVHVGCEGKCPELASAEIESSTTILKPGFILKVCWSFHRSCPFLTIMWVFNFPFALSTQRIHAGFKTTSFHLSSRGTMDPVLYNSYKCSEKMEKSSNISEKVRIGSSSLTLEIAADKKKKRSTQSLFCSLWSHHISLQGLLVQDGSKKMSA